jgi:hypothetical protein
MSRIPVARPIPIGLLVTGSRDARPPTRTKRLPPWLRSATVVAAFSLFALASAGLTVAGLRPVSQSVVETDYLASVEPATEFTFFSPTDLANVEESSEYIEPGEARPSTANPKPSSLYAASADVPKTEPIAIPKRMKQSQTHQCGTAIDFVRSQSIAFDRAAREQKLVMVLHVAGNFEDPGFT